MLRSIDTHWETLKARVIPVISILKISFRFPRTMTWNRNETETRQIKEIQLFNYSFFVVVVVCSSVPWGRKGIIIGMTQKQVIWGQGRSISHGGAEWTRQAMSEIELNLSSTPCTMPPLRPSFVLSVLSEIRFLLTSPIVSSSYRAILPPPPNAPPPPPSLPQN